MKVFRSIPLTTSDYNTHRPCQKACRRGAGSFLAYHGRRDGDSDLTCNLNDLYRSFSLSNYPENLLFITDTLL